MLSTYLKKNDLVMVIAGKERGKKGKILVVDFKRSGAIVEKLNLITKHVKLNPSNPSSGIVRKEAPLHFSNLMLFCSKCEKPVRVSRKIEADVKKRICKKCGQEV